MQYATFWQRSVASLVDFIVISPIFLIWYFVIATEHPSKFLQIGANFIIVGIYLAYMIYCHGRDGRTIGKRAMGICVTNTSGNPINWIQAWRRSSIDIILSSLGLILFTAILLLAPDQVFYTSDWTQREQALKALEPKWASWLDWANFVWAMSELVTMLFNSKRRSLHDFIAGTIVIRQAQPARSSIDFQSDFKPNSRG